MNLCGFFILLSEIIDIVTARAFLLLILLSMLNYAKMTALRKRTFYFQGNMQPTYEALNVYNLYHSDRILPSQYGKNESLPISPNVGKLNLWKISMKILN